MILLFVIYSHIQWIFSILLYCVSQFKNVNGCTRDGNWNFLWKKLKKHSGKFIFWNKNLSIIGFKLITNENEVIRHTIWHKNPLLFFFIFSLAIVSIPHANWLHNTNIYNATREKWKWENEMKSEFSWELLSETAQYW